MERQVFKDFPEFWYLTKELSEEQRDIIFHSLSEKEQRRLKRSYTSGGWDDLFIRNQVDDIVDYIKAETGVDIIFMRCKVVMHKSYYMQSKMWEYIIDTFDEFPDEHVYHVLGGIRAKRVNDVTVLIEPDK